MYELLKGMRIVEGSAFVAAPLGGMTLAQLGADVIRFDSIEGGLDSDRWPVTKDGRSLYWAGLNKGKRSIAVDLKSPRGREIVAALITAPGPDAGIFLTNLPARGWLSYEELSKARKDLILLNILGTRSGAAQVDYTVNAATGFPMATGPVDMDGPVNQVLPAWDLTTGLTATTGILAAERRRRQTGEGALIRLPLLDVALATTATLGYVAEAQINGTDRPRYGNHIFGTFGQDFRTADGRYVMVCIFTTRQLHALATATGLADAFAAIEREHGFNLEDEGDRFRARDALVGAIGPWVAARSFDVASAAFESAGVLWGPFRTFRQMAEHEAAAGNPLFTEVDQPGIGRILTPGSPLDYAGLSRLPPRPAPRLGQHTDEILGDLLGLSGAAIGALHDEGVVASPSD